jgi:predicted Zn-dependent protease
MSDTQRHAKIANEMADRLQRSSDVPRWNKSERQTIGEWAEYHEMTFVQAIRRLVQIALKAETPAKPSGKPGRCTRAAELATKTIEKIIDPSAPAEERAQRRRRLTKGPPEFREDRVDLPKKS